MRILNQHSTCRAEVGLAGGKRVLRLFDANGALRVQMDAAGVERVTISRAGQAQVVMAPARGVGSPAADYGLTLYGADGKPARPNPKPPA